MVASRRRRSVRLARGAAKRHAGQMIRWLSLPLLLALTAATTDPAGPILSP